MKKSYSSLNTLSAIIIVLGYLNLFVGIIISVFIFNTIKSDTSVQYNDGLAIVSTIGAILLTLLSSLFLWAIGQFIKLCVNIAQDISTVNDNVFYIAEILAKKGKQQNSH